MAFFRWGRPSGRWWGRLLAVWLILWGLLHLTALNIHLPEVVTVWVLGLLALAAGVLLLLDR